ncbi:MAG: hypothetical protein EOR51_11545 [Mesorhizobium sp.]|uniref:hypothetical protein n=1 Tax=Mesorhizobium sp. TaxID=1871066 RepID=UPI000FE6C903|nr:hypothetical protein [Mesorhizobium sp.]RWH94128.1 MAG: hypothetical protein EOQ88_27390 [Mesorhizobium sp.]RWK82757.1 MAG: hypothetical protein EOR51_11545 [Mesorhizobium sp.]RWL06564.1 MAG: hypothetical protein EOR55_09330 [Mesorhizobium sp.]
MATERQYAFLKFLYEEENARENTINQYAKTLLSLITFYSGFVIFVADKMLATITLPMKVMFATTLASMLAAFATTVWGTRMADFEGVCDPEEACNELPAVDDDESENLFLRKGIADFTVATTRNSGINNRRAKTLLVESYFLAAGILSHAVFFMIALF